MCSYRIYFVECYLYLTSHSLIYPVRFLLSWDDSWTITFSISVNWPKLYREIWLLRRYSVPLVSQVLPFHFFLAPICYSIVRPSINWNIFYERSTRHIIKELITLVCVWRESYVWWLPFRMWVCDSLYMSALFIKFHPRSAALEFSCLNLFIHLRCYLAQCVKIHSYLSHIVFFLHYVCV